MYLLCYLLIGGPVHQQEVSDGASHLEIGALERHLSGQVIRVAAHVPIAKVCMVHSREQDDWLLCSRIPAQTRTTPVWIGQYNMTFIACRRF